MVDDLVDEAPTPEEAKTSLQEALHLLDYKWSNKRADLLNNHLRALNIANSDENASSRLASSIMLIPASRLTLTPILELLAGFAMDLEFSVTEQRFPIITEADLEKYAKRVAGTVATSLLELVFHYYPDSNVPCAEQRKIMLAAERMGQALQYVNISRDIKRDAAIGRVYIPISWLEEEAIKPLDVVGNPDDPRLAKFEERMIQKAEQQYQTSVQAIGKLPRRVRGPVKTTVESYMMIADMVRDARCSSKIVKGKLKVPLWRRLTLAWREMYANA